MESAAAALRILDERSVDVILSDHKMPGMSGVQLLARAGEMKPDIVRMLITGWTREIPTERLEEVGVCALVTKPWDDAKLKATLRVAMGAAPDTGWRQRPSPSRSRKALSTSQSASRRLAFSAALG